MAYLSCPSCGLGVQRGPHDTIYTDCPRCGRVAVEVDRLSPDFRCAIRREPGGAVIELSGELDAWTARQLDARVESLRADGIGSVAVDLRGLRFIDSSGLAALLAWTRRGGEVFAFELIDGAPPVDRVLDLCGMRDMFVFRGSSRPGETSGNG